MLKVVGDVDDEVVPPVGDDGWPRDCAVESQRLAHIAIWRECCVFNGKPVLYQWLVWSRLS